MHVCIYIYIAYYSIVNINLINFTRSISPVSTLHRHRYHILPSLLVRPPFTTHGPIRSSSCCIPAAADFIPSRDLHGALCNGASTNRLSDKGSTRHHRRRRRHYNQRRRLLQRMSGRIMLLLVSRLLLLIITQNTLRPLFSVSFIFFIYIEFFVTGLFDSWYCFY